MRKPMAGWAVDLTWLKEVSHNSLGIVEKDSQVVFTCIDMFSKFAFAEILPNKQGKTVAAAIRRCLAGGAPSTIRSDNGSEFLSTQWKAVTTEFGIKHLFSETCAPKQNATIERFNKTLKSAVYRYLTHWNLTKLTQADLQKLVTGYNNTKHTTTHQVPSEVHGGDAAAVKNARSEI
eukprot:TRINITY_DN4009_c0_g2_i1.p1 TRINITY_DN4009_c0_g2~~TRINITY_DN4009_c0_g2_i1.p1  ORF type:complete len:177 (+),score=2.93 TRINITY_DN4009_c0_g2_i1:175-705(+)